MQDLFMRALENGMGLSSPSPHNYEGDRDYDGPQAGEVIFEQRLHFNPNQDTPVWIQKDGTGVELKDMADSHIINARRMVMRAIESGKLVQAVVFHYRQWMVEFNAELDKRDIPLMVR